jgi:HAD superfamily hydrolase (TIGR01484 family)
MQKPTHLAIFDIDGTIAGSDKVIPGSVLQAMKHLQSKGYVTTVATGRGLQTMHSILQDDFDSVISDGAYAVLEHGAKIVDRAGNVVFMEEFGPNELAHVHDFIRANIEMIDELWFGVPDPKRKLQYWVQNPQRIEEITNKYPMHADVFSCTLGELKERLQAQPISNIEARAKSHVQPGNMKIHFTRSNLDMNMNTAGIFGFFMNNTNKGLAVRYVINKLGIPMKNVLVAANGINDIEMLNLDVGTRILVGPEEERNEIKGYLSNTEEIIEVENPEALGKYLQKL